MTNPMLEQVYSLPVLITETVEPFDHAVRQALDHELCLSLKRLYITGCGDSHHAAVGTEMAFEVLTGLPTRAMTALQYGRYAARLMPKTGPKTNAVFGISVSGEVSRTLEALQQGRANGAITVAVTATSGSRIYEAGDCVVLTATAPFAEPRGVHVPGVRSYLANQLALLLAALRIGEVRGHLTTAEANRLRAELAGLAQVVETTIQSADAPARQLAEEWVDAHEFVFAGAGPNYATAMFSAAKVLEASGDAAMAQETEEWTHLQYFARIESTPTFLITNGEADRSRMIEMAVAARKLGRRTVAVAPASVKELHRAVDRSLSYAEGMREMFSPLVACIPAELFAAYRADVTGEPYFRDFQGGRSVENGDGISRIRTSELLPLG
ncbi:MAG TPA: SIS domain-containing protein [Levilinea sp.]|nr:SIS domain-containing protein [Levilinea sp.]